MINESFRVDLRGIVEILSHHLYSSPQVYLRELIQNARDAIVARRALGNGGSERIDVYLDLAEGVVRIRDEGIGLTEEEMRTMLATIGASSKRGDFLQTRREYLGQFGIGLLSCFLVADEIEVRSRSARQAQQPTVHWVGRSSGTYVISHDAQPLDAPGTEVLIRARPDERDWVNPERVGELIELFASLLDLPVYLHEDQGAEPELLTTQSPPWQGTEASRALWCRQNMGFDPIAALPVSVPVVGVQGVAFIAQDPGRVGGRRGDTVYSRGMFVSGDNMDLAPGWAYFARLAVEAGDLPLMASREALQKTAAVTSVSEQIGEQIRSGIERLAVEDPAAFQSFLDVHGKGLLAMAVSDADVLNLVFDYLNWETNEGPMTLRAALRRYSTINYAPTQSDFTTFAPLLRAQGSLLINGSYVYGTEILALVSAKDAYFGRFRRMNAEKILKSLRAPAPNDPIAAEVSEIAGPVLRRLDMDLDLRVVEPASVSVIYIEPEERPMEAPAADDPWAGLLSTPATPPPGPRLVMNLNNPSVRALRGIGDPALRQDVVRGLYAIGLLTAGKALDDDQTDLLQRTLLGLITAAG